MLLLRPKVIIPMMIKNRTFKNFGHKRQPIPFVTSLWHGFLTFTFIGMGLNWDKFGTWVLGEDNLRKLDIDWDDAENS